MKILILLSALIISNTTFAYTEWREFTPNHIFSELKFVRSKLVLRTKGGIDTCAGLFPGNRFRARVVSCEEINLLSTNVEVAIDYKVRSHCQKQASHIDKTFVLDIDRSCLRKMSMRSTITINGRSFERH